VDDDHKMFGRIGLRTMNNPINFARDLHSDLDPGILFLLRLIATCKSATLLLFARCQHYNAHDFRDQPDFKIVYQFNNAN